jgi:hypothetical protein
MPRILGFFLPFSQISNFFIKNQPIIYFSADFYVRLFRCHVAEVLAARKKGSSDWGTLKYERLVFPFLDTTFI